MKLNTRAFGLSFGLMATLILFVLLLLGWILTQDFSFIFGESGATAEPLGLATFLINAVMLLAIIFVVGFVQGYLVAYFYNYFISKK